MNKDFGNLHEQIGTLAGVSYLDDLQLSDGLLAGQIRCALVVACADMGANLPYVCSATTANLLIFQDFGHRTSQKGIADLVADGIASNLVVYGHSDCSFARFLTKPHLQDQAGQQFIFKYLEPDSENIQCQYCSNLSKDELIDWRRVSEWSVLNELRLLLLYPQVVRRIERQQLKIHGWVYEASNKSLHVFNPHMRRFVQASHRISDMVSNNFSC